MITEIGVVVFWTIVAVSMSHLHAVSVFHARMPQWLATVTRLNHKWTKLYAPKVVSKVRHHYAKLLYDYVTIGI